MSRFLLACAAVLIALSIAGDAVAQNQRGGGAGAAPAAVERTIVVPAPAVTIETPAPTVNITTPAPVVNVTVPEPVVTLAFPESAAGTGGGPTPRFLSLAPGEGSFLGALIGVLAGLGAVALTGWVVSRNVREQLSAQAERTRDDEARRREHDKRAIATALLPEIGWIKTQCQADLAARQVDEESPEEKRRRSLKKDSMPRYNCPVFKAYAGRLHVLPEEAINGVVMLYASRPFMDWPDRGGETLVVDIVNQLQAVLAHADMADTVLRFALNPAPHEPAPNEPAPAPS